MEIKIYYDALLHISLDRYDSFKASFCDTTAAEHYIISKAALKCEVEMMINLTFSNHSVGFPDLNSSTYLQADIPGFNTSEDDLVRSVVISGNSTRNFSTAVNHSQHAHDDGWFLKVYSREHLILTSFILGLFVLCCIIGNCFVIAAVMLERSLHNVANYLILSLAVADLMVAVLVMPLSVVSEISQVSVSATFASVCCYNHNQHHVPCR